MKKIQVWKRLMLMDKYDKKQLVIILMLRVVVYCVYGYYYFRYCDVEKFDIGLIFGFIFCALAFDVIDVFKNFITYTDKLYLKLNEKED